MIKETAKRVVKYIVNRCKNMLRTVMSFFVSGFKKFLSIFNPPAKKYEIHSGKTYMQHKEFYKFG